MIHDIKLPGISFYRSIQLRSYNLLAYVFCCLIAVQSFAKTNTEAWQAFDRNSNQVIDHSLWQQFLERYVESSDDGINRVNYSAVSDRDKARLEEYIKKLSVVEVSDLNRQEQLAYWINLYNALTIDLILQSYPVSSIRKLGSGIFSFGPWNDDIFVVQGEALSLNDIEHQIIRPVFKDERIHYVVNCASLGCPDLFRQAFSGEKIDQQLDTAACNFIQHPRAVSFDGDKLKLSSIYKWYSEDFGKNVGELLDHLTVCAKGDLLEKLKAFHPTRRSIKYHYDWQLNDVTKQ